MNTFTSRLNNQDTIINNFAPHVIDIIDQQDATILPQVVRSVVQEELRTSAPDTIALEQRLQASVADSITHAMTTNLAIEPIITSLINDVRDLRTKSTAPSKKTGFSQLETKDFHASKLESLLTGVVLNGDSLLDLELFFDSILSKFESITLTSSLYPQYGHL
jgi:hypothetical protein